jgi:hypothetical protein
MPDPKYPELAARLLAMGEADQAMRQGAPWDGALDIAHTDQLKAIIAEYGWPSVSLVGWYASDAAWLIAQHACHDLPFMKEVLATLKDLPGGEEVRLSHVALLEDRILMFEGKPQLYGSQFRGTGADMVPHEIADPDGLDARRAAVGLEPWAEYEARVRL